jgi:hypothetical protein
MQLSYKYAQVDVLGGMLRDFCALYNAALQQRIEACNRRHISLGLRCERRAVRALSCGLPCCPDLPPRATNQRPVYEP